MGKNQNVRKTSFCKFPGGRTGEPRRAGTFRLEEGQPCPVRHRWLQWHSSKNERGSGAISSRVWVSPWPRAMVMNRQPRLGHDHKACEFDAS